METWFSTDPDRADRSVCQRRPGQLAGSTRFSTRFSPSPHRLRRRLERVSSFVEPFHENPLEKQRDSALVIEVGEQCPIADEGDRRVREGVPRCVRDASEVLPRRPLVTRDGRAERVPRWGLPMSLFQTASRSPVCGMRSMEMGAAVPRSAETVAAPHVSPPSSEMVWYCPPSPVRRNMNTRPSFRSTAAGSQQPPPEGFTCSFPPADGLPKRASRNSLLLPSIRIRSQFKESVPFVAAIETPQEQLDKPGLRCHWAMSGSLTNVSRSGTRIPALQCCLVQSIDCDLVETRFAVAVHCHEERTVERNRLR